MHQSIKRHGLKKILKINLFCCHLMYKCIKGYQVTWGEKGRSFERSCALHVLQTAVHVDENQHINNVSCLGKTISCCQLLWWHLLCCPKGDSFAMPFMESQNHLG